MGTSKLCIIVCANSLSELVVREALKELGNDVALCPLSMDATGVENVKDAITKAKYVMVVDSCSDECGKNVLKPSEYTMMNTSTSKRSLALKCPAIETLPLKSWTMLGWPRPTW